MRLASLKCRETVDPPDVVGTFFVVSLLYVRNVVRRCLGGFGYSFLNAPPQHRDLVVEHGNAPANVSAIRPAMRLSGTRTADTPIPVPDLAEDAGLFGLQHSLQASPVLGLLFQLIRVRAFLSIFLQLLNLLQATFNLRPSRIRKLLLYGRVNWEQH